MKKELVTLLTIYLLFIVLLIACRKVVDETPVIDLGKQSTATAITKLSTPITTGEVEITMNVTPGAKYSLQLIDLKGDVKSATGFTADNSVVIKKLNYSDVNSGDYSITLIDVSGKEYKRSLTIKN